MALFWLILGLVIVLISFYWIREAYLYFTFWKRQGVQDAGMIGFKALRMPTQDYLLKQAKKNGRIFGVYATNYKILIINDASLARELCIKETHNFPYRTFFHIGDSNIKHSLFMMKADENWKRVRSIVTPAFTSGKLKAMISPIENIVNNFIKHLRPYSESGQVFDIKTLTSAFTMDVISTCAYGIEIDSLSNPNHPIVTNAKKILGVDASLSFFISLMFPTVARFFGMQAFDKKAAKFFDDLTFKIIEKRMQSNQTEQKDFLGLLIENADEMNDFSVKPSTNLTSLNKLKGVSKEEIAGQGILFFIAGFDTTNSTLCHIIFYLAQHQEWQKKLLCELVKFKSDLSHEKLRDLPILNAIINETLRLKPPLILFQRSSKKDQEFLDTGIKLSGKTIISIQPYCIHRDPEYFPDPESFKPERFFDKSLESSSAYMPFGAGSRLCVGMRFALNELRLAVAHLILNYRLMGDDAENTLKLEYFNGTILLTPKKVMVRIARR